VAKLSSQSTSRCHSRTGFHAGTHRTPQSKIPNGGKGSQMFCNLPYLLNIVPADFFLCQRVKLELARLSLFQESFKTSCDGVVQIIAVDEFIDAFRRGMDRCKKCVRIGCDQA
jgi:hypothetical protein